MICPKCGTEMKEGALYCECCGEDIHIVPDFEPELEFNLEQAINGIAREIKDEEESGRTVYEKEAASEEPLKSRKSRNTLKRRRTLLIVELFVLAAVVMAAVYGGIAAYRYNSLSYQVNSAARCVERKQYDRAVNYYERAAELDKENINLKFALAEAYLLKNNKIEYEYLLREIIKSDNATTEQLQSAYGKLIAVYEGREDYETINQLLLQCDNSSILSAYRKYIVQEPQFSLKEGYYSEVKPLKLTTTGTGSIYYTLDGSTPDENSALYTAPIILGDGDYVVKAYFLNDMGLASDCVTMEYHIEADEIPAPEISAISGRYSFPMNIEILSEDQEDIYYTMDGTEPAYSSQLYMGPIPMPLGKSTFKFARIKDGRTGTVAERSYELALNTDLTPKEAVGIVTDYMISTGKIFDETGYFSEINARYIYEYQYVTNIEKKDDFYVIAELYEDTDGIVIGTGNLFAVNAYTGSLFRLQTDTDNRLTLVEIEKESQEQG